MNPIFEIKTEKETEKYGKFVISPLLFGDGNTLGTSLRRVLLSRLPGAAITSVSISGVKHQFSTLKGVREDMLDFLLNLKRVSVSYTGDKPAQISLSVKGPREVKAGDIKTPSGVKISNPEFVIANLSRDSKIELTGVVESGVGYSPAEERGEVALGSIALDANFSPVARVALKIEETRVGRVTNYDKLTLEIWTDGSVSPREALESGARILVGYFDQIVNPKKAAKKEKVVSIETFGSVGSLSVEEIGLPTRIANALARAGYDTVDKLVEADTRELVKVRNLGDKSLDVIKEALETKGVKFDA